MKYQPVIGLEVHIQAKTKSKMFSYSSSEYFGDDPNTHVDPTSMGLPGALPVPNQEAINQTLKLALALDCKINQYSKFDRKNYFYPDLPKGYQISQYDLPFGYEGFLEINVRDDARRIRITRIHLEEDTGKSSHDVIDGKTALDYNKSGVALIELVTEPDFQEVEEVTAFAKLLKQTVEYLGVSDAEMQKGQMRFELNISLKQPGETGLPDYKVEVKNIGSISVLEKVIEFEMQRQAKLLDAGGKIPQQTRGLKDMTGETVEQRVKETADDYRYFPEPDIPPIITTDGEIEAIRSSLPELPASRRGRYIEDWDLPIERAEILVSQPWKGDFMDSVYEQIDSENKPLVTEVTNIYLEEVVPLVGEEGAEGLVVSPTDVIYLAEAKLEKRILSTIIKKVLAQIEDGEGSAEEIVKSQGLETVSDSSEIEKWVDQVIEENPQVVASLEKNPNAIKALIGRVMGLSKGKANPKIVEELLQKKLQ